MDERPEQLPDRATEAADLDRLARANADATWGDDERSGARVPGVLSGDVGPKGRVASQLTHLSRRERIAGSEVPHGAAAPGSAHLVLLPMLAIALALLAIVVLVVWLAS